MKSPDKYTVFNPRDIEQSPTLKHAWRSARVRDIPSLNDCITEASRSYNLLDMSRAIAPQHEHAPYPTLRIVAGQTMKRLVTLCNHPHAELLSEEERAVMAGRMLTVRAILSAHRGVRHRSARQHAAQVPHPSINHRQGNHQKGTEN